MGCTRSTKSNFSVSSHCLDAIAVCLFLASSGLVGTRAVVKVPGSLSVDTPQVRTHRNATPCRIFHKDMKIFELTQEHTWKKTFVPSYRLRGKHEADIQEALCVQSNFLLRFKTSGISSANLLFASDVTATAIQDLRVKRLADERERLEDIQEHNRRTRELEQQFEELWASGTINGTDSDYDPYFDSRELAVTSDSEYDWDDVDTGLEPEWLAISAHGAEGN